MLPLLPFTGQTTPGTDVGPAELVDLLPPVIRVGWFVAGFLAVFLVGWYLLEPAVSTAVRRRNRGNPTIQEAISRYTRLLVLVGAVVVGAAAAGYGAFLSDSALVVAAATLAVGVAAQTVIGSLVSGLVLVSDPEFNVGNYIEWSGGEGEVQSITLRVTRVHTPDGALVTIPNTTLTSEAVARPYGRGRTRVVEHVRLAYEDDVEVATETLESVAGDVEGVLDHPAPAAYLDDLEGDAVVVGVHYWVGDPRQRDLFAVRSSFASDAKERLERAGVTVSPASKRDLQGRIEVEADGSIEP
jgi:small-conductance mechanosensitive channel